MTSLPSEKLRKAREAALWALYGMDLAQVFWAGELDEFFPIAVDQDAELHEVRKDVQARVSGVVVKRAELDDEIRRLSPRWRIERMAIIDRNLLRLGIWELLERKTSPIIVINACVELAKDYGEKNTPAFINGLLDQLCKDHGIEISQQPS
ncbi:transcription antitermination factor NusB [Bradymonas sediminis]|uniref:Transcription antitermination protein NusB n=1 Tax=Bradymonas sediminis TaxID=1548548 RepID=A0A2Z4FJP9_9DELT|nr:transcription antitermination factor NusB [Bradymonas sediminis]AWV89100.1 transcription antitermination factor NusB [Bradymonas sediminis]TDP64435.1 NusB antitermination factor [Bradymonas sediminis]